MRDLGMKELARTLVRVGSLESAGGLTQMFVQPPLRLLVLLPLVLAAAGCATARFEPTVSSFSGPKPDKAYLYGKFQLHGASDIHVVTNNYSSIGLVFLCADGTEFTIGLAPRSPDQLVEIPARRCSLRLLTAHNAMNGRPLSERRYSGTALQNVDFRPGVMHYVGDVTGRRSNESQNGVHIYRWNIEEHVNRFAETTTRLMKEHPAYAALPRADVTGLPPAESTSSAKEASK